jgi:hypothetical protein
MAAAKEAADVRLLWLEDDSGRLPLVLHGVEWVFAREDVFEPGQPLPPGAESFLERHGYRGKSDHVRLKERRIEEGGPLYVHGVVARCSEVLQVLAELQHPVIASAVSTFNPHHPGELAAYLRSRLGQEDRVVWSERSALLISDQPQAAVADSLRWTSRMCHAGAGVLLLLAFASLLFG